ncbi:PREDICTED: helicase domino-like, partial [Priapulus caudatus]|uniref:Helicase domino-like n=1 Tax=Priapulus caudatus TaxID=37621 RepID=A0ABM1F4L9_PRICU
MQLREEEEQRAEEEDEMLYTYSHDDATASQVWVDKTTSQHMPMWAPPTPPVDESDVYIDYSVCFLYEQTPMPESHLPPVYVKKEHKRLHLDHITSRKHHRPLKSEHAHAPRSLFDRPAAAVLKARRDAKLHRLKPSLPEPCADKPEWLIFEDWALLQ